HIGPEHRCREVHAERRRLDLTGRVAAVAGHDVAVIALLGERDLTVGADSLGVARREGVWALLARLLAVDDEGQRYSARDRHGELLGPPTPDGVDAGDLAHGIAAVGPHINALIGHRREHEIELPLLAHHARRERVELLVRARAVAGAGEELGAGRGVAHV